MAADKPNSTEAKVIPIHRREVDQIEARLIKRNQAVTPKIVGILTEMFRSLKDSEPTGQRG